jgi:Holliday junction resolvase RusA-like endonuclease
MLEWPALVAGPVFVVFELGGKPGHKGRHRSRLMIPKAAWIHTQTSSFIPKDRVRMIFISQYPDPATEATEKVLAEAAGLFMRGRAPTENPVALLVHAFKPIPESWSKTDKAKAEAGAILPTSKPDGDNYLKAVQDALNEIVWKDDSQVVDARVIKRYSTEPAMRIEVREMVPPEKLSPKSTEG